MGVTKPKLAKQNRSPAVANRRNIIYAIPKLKIRIEMHNDSKQRLTTERRIEALKEALFLDWVIQRRTRTGE